MNKCPNCGSTHFLMEGYFTATLESNDGEPKILDWEASTPFNIPADCTCMVCDEEWREELDDE